MKFTNKVLLFILFAWTLMFLVVLLGVKYVLIANYIKVEDDISTNAAVRIQNAFQQQVDNIGKAADVWGIWDDTYNYMLGKNEGFIKQALSVESIDGADLDIAILFDNEGKIVFKRALNNKHTDIIDVPVNLLKEFQPNGSLWKFINKPTDDTALKGSFLFQGDILLIGGHAIVHNDGKGPAQGMIVVGKRFNLDDWRTIEEITTIQADIYTLPRVEQVPLLLGHYSKILAGSPVILDRVNDRNINAYTLIRDVNNNPIAMVKVYLSRDIYQAGMESISHFLILYLIVGLIFTLVLFFLIRKILIKPLQEINKEVAEVGKTQNFLTTIPIKGSDEISTLGQEFNKMFETVYEYNEENKHTHEEITKKLEQSDKLKRQLQLAEIFLTDVIDSMPSALFVMDKNLNLIQLNSQAKKETQVDLTKNRTTFLDIYPFMKSYEKDIHSVLDTNEPKALNKITDLSQAEHKHYNVLIFPLAEGTISVRMDDITEYARLQDQVLQNEKLASIGMLTAGVVNEITLPISECHAMLEPLKIYIDSIVNHVKEYQEITKDPDFEKRFKDFQTMVKTWDAKQYIENTYALMNDLQRHASEVASTVKILQNFARLDEDSIRKTDVQTGINSTLTLLAHRLKNKVEIIKNYNPLPAIDCYPGRLNQVFMSVISNAIDAIEDKGSLTITTEVKDNFVELSFKDTGVGMSKEALGKIFDPFYTTKTSGGHKEMGLSFIKGIIEELRGSIEVSSMEGKGTEIIIRLPIHQGQ